MKAKKIMQRNFTEDIGVVFLQCFNLPTSAFVECGLSSWGIYPASSNSESPGLDAHSDGHCLAHIQPRVLLPDSHAVSNSQVEKRPIYYWLKGLYQH